MLNTRVLFFAAAAGVAGVSSAQVEYDPIMCGYLNNYEYGPFDYRKATAAQKNLVEGPHFNADVETLKGYYNAARQMRAPAGADIDYTLRAFPNHQRALYALVRLEEKEGKPKPRGARWPVACYFARAVTFTPDDPGVRVVYGIYLQRRGAKEDAIKQLDAADGKVGNDPSLNYNLGLVYFELGRYEKALEYAKKAYALGFPVQGLKNKLQKAGKWQD